MAPKTPAGGTTNTGHEGLFPQNERADALRQFGDCASTLRDLLYDDRALDPEEFLFMDKHFQVLHMAYLRWKRVHGPTPDEVQH